jgi:fibronectin-binding autotransporter adhesin
MLVMQDFINNAGGTVTVQGGASNPPLMAQPAMARLVNSYSLLDIDGSLANAGNMTLDGYGAEVIVHEGMSNAQDASIKVQNQGYLVSDGTAFSYAGSLLVSNGFAYFMGGVDNAQSGTIEVGGANSGFYSVGSMTSAGTILLNNAYLTLNNSLGAALTINGGTLQGNGGIYGNVVNNGGTIAPGNSAGMLSFMGDLTLGSGSILLMELGSATEAAANDMISISGLFTMDGALLLSTIGGYMPAVGDSFSLFSYGSETGSFASISLPLAGASLSGGQLEILSETSTTNVGTTISQVIVDTATQVSTGSGDTGVLFTVTPIDDEDDDNKQQGKNSTRMICS